MDNKPPYQRRDAVVAELPAPYRLPLTYDDCDEIALLFFKTTRNPHTCISKGQYKTLVEQLGARNHMLTKSLADRMELNAVLVGRIKELEQQLAAGLDDGR